MPTDLTLPSAAAQSGIILFGLDCQTTAIVLQELLTAGVDVRLLCLPGRQSVPVLKTRHRTTLPMSGGPATPTTPGEIAAAHGIDLWRLGDLEHAEVASELAQVKADLVIVACYNRLVPESIYSQRRFGGVNLHPSRLPDKRGPDPLFWVFRNGDDEVGATVHRLTSSFDSGPILAQRSTTKPDGVTEDELDVMLSRLGSSLLLRVFSTLHTGEIEASPQHDEDATWAPHPSTRDFVVDRDWPARRAFNFIRGMRDRRHLILLDDPNGKTRRVVAAHTWRTADASIEIPPGARWIEFADGWLIATVEDSSDTNLR